MKAIRILNRNIRDSFKSVFRNFSLSLASVSCITITLIVVGVSAVLSFNVNNFTKIIEKNVTIVAFLDVDITEEEIDDVYDKIIQDIDSYSELRNVIKKSDSYETLLRKIYLFIKTRCEFPRIDWLESRQY